VESLPRFWDVVKEKRSPWLKIPEFTFNIELFAKFVSQLDPRNSVLAPSKTGEIRGWPLTSLKGSNSYGIDKIDEGAEAPQKSSLIYPTVNCFGYGREVLMQLGLSGFYVSRARILALGPQAEMDFHRDQESTDKIIYPYWRLHIPIVTNPKAKMQWMISGKLVEKHLPADGHCYLVNISDLHRAVNFSPKKTRYHFVCSLFWRSMASQKRHQSNIKV
jgi:hypothetical protein